SGIRASTKGRAAALPHKDCPFGGSNAWILKARHGFADGACVQAGTYLTVLSGDMPDTLVRKGWTMDLSGVMPPLRSRELTGLGDGAELDRAVAYGPAVIVRLDQPDGFADQGFAEEEKTSLPLDFAILAHASNQVVGTVLWLAQTAAPITRGRLVDAAWRHLAEGLMWPLLVEVAAEAIEPALLSAQVGSRWTCGLVLERAVQPLMTSVLLWLARRNTFRPHPGLD